MPLVYGEPQAVLGQPLPLGIAMILCRLGRDLELGSLEEAGVFLSGLKERAGAAG